MLWQIVPYRLRHEPLVNNFERVRDHVIGLLERPETGQNLVVNAFRQLNFVERVKLVRFVV